MIIIQPKVSIIIPVYNVEKYLACCVNSALRQTYKNVEIILVDDGSTDSCPQICDKYETAYPNVTVVHQTNKGPSEARNAGTRIADGEYIYFLDSDDYIRDDAIETLVRTTEGKDVDIVLFDAIVVDENDVPFESETERNRYVRQNSYCGVFSGINMLRSMIRNHDIRFSTPLMFLKREYLRDNCLFFYPGVLHEDVLFVFKVLVGAERVVHIPEKLFFRRVRSGSIMTSEFTYKNVFGYCKAIQGIIDCCDALPDTCRYREFAEQIFSLISGAVNIFVSLPENERSHTCNELSDTLEKTRKCRIINTHFSGLFDFSQKYQNASHIIFYSAGRKCKSTLETLQLLGYRLPDVIWDQSADGASQIMAIPVNYPDFESLMDRHDWVLVVCIADTGICDDIIARCAEYKFYHAYEWQGLYIDMIKCI